MEISLQFMEIIPSINDIKTSKNDKISLLLTFENSKVVISNLEKNILKQNITLLHIKNYNKQLNYPLIKISILKNSNIIGFLDFIPSNESKWLNISSVNNNYPNFKIFIQCIIQIKNKNKINSIFNNSEKNFSQNNIITKKIGKINNIPLSKSFKKINSNIEIIDYKSNNKEKLHELNDIFANSIRNFNLKEKKNLFTQSSKNNNSNSSLKLFQNISNTTRNRITKRIKTPPSKRFKDKSPLEKHNRKNHSQKNIEVAKIKKYKNKFFKDKQYKNSEDDNFEKSIENEKIIVENNSQNIILDNGKNSSYEINISDDNKNFSSESNFFYNDFNDKSNKVFNNVKRDFLRFYNEEYLKSINNNMINLETHFLIEKILDLQNTFHKQFISLLILYNKYKNIYDTFTYKYYLFTKKYNKLKSKSKNVDIKKMRMDISNPKNKYENMPLLMINEVKIWKKMINQNDLSKIVELTKDYLISIFISVIFSHKNKLSILQKKYCKDIIERYKNKNKNSFEVNKHQKLNNELKNIIKPKKLNFTKTNKSNEKKTNISNDEELINNNNKQIKRKIIFKK